jgi:alpha-1,2-mannosyltransferase
MKATVIHHTLNNPGGETSVAIETIDALYELGYDIELVTSQKPDLKKMSKDYGKRLPIKKVKSVFPFKINAFGIYQRLLHAMPLSGLKESDIIINTNGNTLPYNTPSKAISILYIHFPSLLMRSESYSNTKYQKSLFWKCYFKPYQVVSNVFTNKALSMAKIIFTNSRFTKDAIRKAYPHITPHVLYPPVNIDRFSSAYKSRSRDRKVLVISRFSPEKQIENAILISKQLKNIEFEIIGSLIPLNKPYFNYLQKMVRDYGLEKRVRFTPNATNKELIGAMATSSIYLHTMKGEHFGVSIVEAMAAGLVPIVPSYGGCSEIAPKEYLYDTQEDAVDCILKNIDGYDDKKRDIMRGIAEKFNQLQYRQSLKYYIEGMNNNNFDNKTDRIHAPCIF